MANSDDSVVNDRLFTAKQAAEFYGCSLRKLFGLRDKGLPFVRIGGSVRYSRQDLIAYIDQCRVRERQDESHRRAVKAFNDYCRPATVEGGAE